MHVLQFFPELLPRVNVEIVEPPLPKRRVPHPSLSRVRVLTLLFSCASRVRGNRSPRSAAVQPSIPPPVPCKTLNNLIPACYPYLVFAKFHPRRTLVSFFPLTPNPDSLSPKSSPYLVTSLPPYFLFFSKSFPCHTSENSPVSPTIATLPKTAVSKPSVCHTSEPPGGCPHPVSALLPLLRRGDR
jgi:hypothetical protein